MSIDLQKKIAIVTGAGRGIGRAIALRLAAGGCRVAGLARTEPEIEDTAREVDSFAPGRFLAVPVDITDDQALGQAVTTILESLGRVTVLVNNAGYAPPRTLIHKTPVADLDRTLGTCLRAPMILTRLVLPDMLAHREGAIINIISRAGRQGRAGEAAYAAAKFGLMGFSESLFEEVREYGIKVASIFSGLVDTGFVPPNKTVDRSKFLQPADIADLVYQILTAPVRVCPTEIVVEPQFDPEKR